MAAIHVTSGIVIDESELNERFVLASGPGGQNVNKVNSKVVLYWSVASTPSLPPAVRQRFLPAAVASVLTADPPASAM